jgi:hypothetical protein
VHGSANTRLRNSAPAREVRSARAAAAASEVMTALIETICEQERELIELKALTREAETLR